MSNDPELSSSTDADSLPLDSAAVLRLQAGVVPRSWTRPAEELSLPADGAPAVSGSRLVPAVLLMLMCGFLGWLVASPPSPSPVAHTKAPPVVPAVPNPPPPPPPTVPALAQLPTTDVPDPSPPPPPPPSVEQALPPPPNAPERTRAAKPADVKPPAPPGALMPLPTDSPARRKAKILTSKGIVALRDEDLLGAEETLVRAAVVDPTFPDAWRHLGIARARLGDRKGARRAYEKYLELAPAAKDAPRVREILDEDARAGP